MIISRNKGGNMPAFDLNNPEVWKAWEETCAGVAQIVLDLKQGAQEHALQQKTINDTKKEFWKSTLNVFSDLAFNSGFGPTICPTLKTEFEKFLSFFYLEKDWYLPDEVLRTEVEKCIVGLCYRNCKFSGFIRFYFKLCSENRFKSYLTPFFSPSCTNCELSEDEKLVLKTLFESFDDFSKTSLLEQALKQYKPSSNFALECFQIFAATMIKQLQ
jgi:hypothetical protein